jgi:hypothetical protein
MTRPCLVFKISPADNNGKSTNWRNLGGFGAMSGERTFKLSRSQASLALISRRQYCLGLVYPDYLLRHRFLIPQNFADWRLSNVPSSTSKANRRHRSSRLLFLPAYIICPLSQSLLRVSCRYGGVFDILSVHSLRLLLGLPATVKVFPASEFRVTSRFIQQH